MEEDMNADQRPFPQPRYRHAFIWPGVSSVMIFVKMSGYLPINSRNIKCRLSAMWAMGLYAYVVKTKYLDIREPSPLWYRDKPRNGGWHHSNEFGGWSDKIWPLSEWAMRMGSKFKRSAELLKAKTPTGTADMPKCSGHLSEFFLFRGETKNGNSKVFSSFRRSASTNQIYLSTTPARAARLIYYSEAELYKWRWKPPCRWQLGQFAAPKVKFCGNDLLNVLPPSLILFPEISTSLRLCSISRTH